MKHRYFVRGTVLGLLLVPAVAASFYGRGVLLFLSTSETLVPIATGYLSALKAAVLADQLRAGRRPRLHAAVAAHVAIFTFGTLAGCLANFLLNGRILSPPFSLGNEFWSWAGIPAFWLLAIGVPCAAGVALLNALVDKVASRKQN